MSTCVYLPEICPVARFHCAVDRLQGLHVREGLRGQILGLWIESGSSSLQRKLDARLAGENALKLHGLHVPEQEITMSSGEGDTQ